MEEKYHIRHANAGDLDRVGEITRQAWARIHESYRKIIGEEMHRDICANWEEEKEAQVRHHWEVHPDGFRVVESIETGQVVGFITFRIDDAKSMGQRSAGGQQCRSAGSTEQRDWHADVQLCA